MAQHKVKLVLPYYVYVISNVS